MIVGAFPCTRRSNRREESTKRLEGPQNNNSLAARATPDEEDMDYDTFGSPHLPPDPPSISTTDYSEAQIAMGFNGYAGAI